jgi:hypothetical protein
MKKILLALTLVFVFVGTAIAARTATPWVTTGEDGVGVIPYLWSDATGTRIMFVDFESKNFDKVEYVYYNLEYDTSEQHTKRGVEGSFMPYKSSPDGEFEGVPYYRKRLDMGTCSGIDCVYFNNPTNVKLTVNTNMLDGQVDQYTKVISFPNDLWN